MNNSDFLEYMQNHDYVEAFSDIHQKFYELSEHARKIVGVDLCLEN